MDPTFIYNNYHLQRRKMYQNNPRSNLRSTIQFSWKDSIEMSLSPRERMQKRRQQERRQIGERSNQLIAKRLKKQVGFKQQQYWKNNKGQKQPILINRSINSNSNNYYFETLNDQIQSYNSNKYNSFGIEERRKSQSLKKESQSNSSQDKYNCGGKTNRYSNYANNYKSQFDPQLQSRASRRSMASSDLSSLVSGNNFLGNYLNQRLQKYLVNNSNKNIKNVNKEMSETKCQQRDELE